MTTAGTYLFVASVSMGYFPSVVGTERMDIQWSDGTAFGNKATVNASHQQPAICWGIKTISANAVLRLVCTNINSNPGVVEAEQATALSIVIYKI